VTTGARFGAIFRHRGRAYVANRQRDHSDDKDRYIEGMQPSELATKILKSNANMTMVIDNLERRGLVARRRQDNDRRCIDVHLTRSGSELIETIVRWMEQQGMEVPDPKEYKKWKDSAPPAGEIYPQLLRWKQAYDEAV